MNNAIQATAYEKIWRDVLFERPAFTCTGREVPRVLRLYMGVRGVPVRLQFDQERFVYGKRVEHEKTVYTLVPRDEARTRYCGKDACAHPWCVIGRMFRPADFLRHRFCHFKYKDQGVATWGFYRGSEFEPNYRLYVHIAYVSHDPLIVLAGTGSDLGYRVDRSGTKPV